MIVCGPGEGSTRIPEGLACDEYCSGVIKGHHSYSCRERTWQAIKAWILGSAS